MTSHFCKTIKCDILSFGVVKHYMEMFGIQSDEMKNVHGIVHWRNQKTKCRVWNSQQRREKNTGWSKSVQDWRQTFSWELQTGSCRVPKVVILYTSALKWFQLLLFTTMAKIKGLYKKNIKEAIWGKFQVAFWKQNMEDVVSSPVKAPLRMVVIHILSLPGRVQAGVFLTFSKVV